MVNRTRPLPVEALPTRVLANGLLLVLSLVPACKTTHDIVVERLAVTPTHSSDRAVKSNATARISEFGMGKFRAGIRAADEEVDGCS